MSDRPAPLPESTVPAPPVPDPTAATRRTVLRAAGLAALTGGGVAVLGACGADGAPVTPASSAPASSAPASSAPASSAPASSPAASPSASASASSSAPVPEGPTVAAADVPVGGGVILEDANFVVTQPTKGKFKAFDKICTHQSCPVTEVTSTINCKCHGSAFSISDGSVQKGPATKALAESPVEVAGDQVVVTG